MGEVINIKETPVDYILDILEEDETKEKIAKAENVMIIVQWRESDNILMHDVHWGTNNMKDLIYMMEYAKYKVFESTTKD